MTDLEPYVLEQVQNVSTSTAFEVLATLVDTGQVSDEKADVARAKFERICKEIRHSLAIRSTLDSEARALEESVEAGKRKLAEVEAAQAPYAGLTVAGVRSDVASAWSEAKLAEQQEELVQKELEQITAERDSLAEQLDGISDRHANSLQPILAEMNKELAVMKEALATERERAAAAQQELRDANYSLEKAQADYLASVAQRQEQHLALAKVEAAPDKARRAADLAAADVKLAERLVEDVGRKVHTADSTVKAVEAKLAALEEEHARLQAAKERTQLNLVSKEREIEQSEQVKQLHELELERLLAVRVDIEVEEKRLNAEFKVHDQSRARANLEKQQLLRVYTECERAVQKEKDALPNLLTVSEQLQKEISVVHRQIGEHNAEVAALRQEVDVRISTFLRSETIGKEVAALFELSAAELVVLEEQVVGLQAEERQRLRAVAAASEQRDRTCRLVGAKQKKVYEAQQMVALRAMEAADLQRVLLEVGERGHDLSSLHDLVRNQRNKLVHLINAAHQGAAEMADKLKVLEAEADILRGQADKKGQLLKQAQNRYTEDIHERDSLQQELQQLRSKLQAQEAIVEEGAQQVEQLNGVINRIEADMLAMRQQYKDAIERRNATGIMLIDRNDELCVLYERQALQESVLAAGAQEMAARDDELRILRLHVAELQRSIEVAQGVAPQEKAQDDKIARALQELFLTQREAAELEAQLEDPNNQDRFRHLDGRIPSAEELSAKVAELQERLAMKVHQLQQRQVLLNEVTALAAQLAAQAGDHYPVKLAMAEQMCSAQNRLKDVTRKIMALVSELSMYQATAMKLASDRQELADLVERAQQLLAAGQPPTEDADEEWQKLQRQEAAVQDLQHQREQVKQLLSKQQQQQQQQQQQEQPGSTAEARPNAYIPDNLGIPKPYGAFAPFKPTELGTTMRHIRKPQPKEVVI